MFFNSKNCRYSVNYENVNLDDIETLAVIKNFLKDTEDKEITRVDINLSNNKIGFMGVAAIVEHFKKFPEVPTFIDLSHNQIDNLGIQILEEKAPQNITIDVSSQKTNSPCLIM